MPAIKVMKKTKKPSFARLTPLAKGRIVGLREVGTERKNIVQRVKKKDGKSPSLQAVDNVLQRFKEDPEWDGGSLMVGGSPMGDPSWNPSWGGSPHGGFLHGASPMWDPSRELSPQKVSPMGGFPMG